MKLLRILVLLTLITVFSTSCTNAQEIVSRPIKPTKTQNNTNIQTKNNLSSKKSEKHRTRLSEPNGYVNGHGYVDLGLLSVIKWATCNIGSISLSDFSNYYAWNETSPKSDYQYNNCFDCLDDHGHTWNTYKIEDKTQILK